MTPVLCPSVKQVFKDMEFLGWYTTGGPPDQSDIHIHKQVCEHKSQWQQFKADFSDQNDETTVFMCFCFPFAPGV